MYYFTVYEDRIKTLFLLYMRVWFPKIFSPFSVIACFFYLFLKSSQKPFLRPIAIKEYWLKANCNPEDTFRKQLML